MCISNKMNTEYRREIKILRSFGIRYRITDSDDVLARLTESGFEVSGPRELNYGHVWIALDPDGNAVELVRT